MRRTYHVILKRRRGLVFTVFDRSPIEACDSRFTTFGGKYYRDCVKKWFSSQKHFSEVFKFHFELTPSEYRAEHHVETNLLIDNKTSELGASIEQIVPSPEILVKLSRLYHDVEPGKELNKAPFEKRKLISRKRPNVV